MLFIDIYTLPIGYITLQISVIFKFLFSFDVILFTVKLPSLSKLNLLFLDVIHFTVKLSISSFISFFDLLF